jgi:hypothetical protein
MKNNKIIKAIFLLTFAFVGTNSAYALGPAAVDLGSAGNFIIMSKTAISTTGATAITGDIGISPAAASYMTGFSQTMNSSNKYSTSTYVTGKIYASDYTSPTPSYMTTAVSDMEAAYVDAMGRTLPTLNFNAGNLGSQSLAPDLYKFTTGVTIPTNLTLTGGPSDVYIFQIDGNLDISSGISIILSGGALPENIFWAVAGTTTLNTTSIFKGVVLAGPGTSTIAMNTGATLQGRLLGQKNISLDANIINGVSAAADPFLTITKVVINNNGRSNSVSDFPLFVGATSVISGAANSFASGDYLISETINSNYSQSFSGDCDSTGNITIYPGINASCTITNDDIAAVSHSGGGIVYGCKDPAATNYSYFVASKPSLCIYGDTPSISEKQVVASVIIPKLPKTGFAPQEKWYESILNFFYGINLSFPLNQ